MVLSPRKPPPAPFGDYLLLDRISIGGMAEIWRAKMFGSEGGRRLVALKRILPFLSMDEEFVAMFLDEGRLGLQLLHANIAQTFELGQVNSEPFLSMEYVPGKSLGDLFDHQRKQGEPAPIPLVCHCIAELCEGLDYAHRRTDGAGRLLNIVHRKGKFGYMSLEQIDGPSVDRRADVFVIGVCLYELLTGERLFAGDNPIEIVEKMRRMQVAPPSAHNLRIPQPLERIIFRALAPNVNERYSYASELGEDLRRFLAQDGEDFTRQDLRRYLRAAFAQDVQREEQRQQEYARIAPPKDFDAP
jgi:eukaryotic-like serine/threonine-protein kinase